VTQSSVLLDHKLTSLVQTLCASFVHGGHELYLVGGAVRDMLLGRSAEELDFATDAKPLQTVALLETIPGASIYRVGEKFGTIGVVLDGVRSEITTYRAHETYEPSSRKPVVRYGSTIHEDLSRRDFTMNAVAVPADALGDTGGWVTSLIDPFAGRSDLALRIVRAVGDPVARFREDPLRMLRAIRFAVTLDLQIESATWSAMRNSAAAIATISSERVAEELAKLLVIEDPRRGLTLFAESGLLAAATPRLAELLTMPDHGPNHPLSLWDHTLNVVRLTSPDLVTRWAAFLHDIGKPSTRTFDEHGRIHFPHHEVVGADEGRRVLQDLRRSNALVDSVVQLVATHMQLHAYSPEWSDGAVRRLVHKLSDDFPRAIDLGLADARGHGNTSWGASKIEALLDRAAGLSHVSEKLESPLDGEALMERYQRPPGPWIKAVKGFLRNQVIDGRLAPDDKATAGQMADEFVDSMGA
jgi:poly(A) polymerase